MYHYGIIFFTKFSYPIFLVIYTFYLGRVQYRQQRGASARIFIIYDQVEWFRARFYRFKKNKISWRGMLLNIFIFSGSQISVTYSAANSLLYFLVFCSLNLRHTGCVNKNLVETTGHKFYLFLVRSRLWKFPAVTVAIILNLLLNST